MIDNRQIYKVAVLGAGVMGAQIAAHFINAKIPTILFDLPGSDLSSNNEKNNNQPASLAIAKLTKQTPAPLGQRSDMQFIQAANYLDDLLLLNSCDLIIEAVAENLTIKQDLYKKIALHLPAHAILVSNTSGLSIESLAGCFSQLNPALSKRFCGVHFFNPPRYMHLVELIPLALTSKETVSTLESFITKSLGKGVIHARDTPNFIANRIGISSILITMIHTEKYKLPYDLVDELTGLLSGRAKSATFRTADIIGLDVLRNIISTMRTRLPNDPFADLYKTPVILDDLISRGNLGQKTGRGFYAKETNRKISVLTDVNGNYVQSFSKITHELIFILENSSKQEHFLQLLHKSSDHQAKFLWAIFRDLFHYIAIHLTSITDNPRNIDCAMRWGFGWQKGPFEEWQAAGWKQIVDWINEDLQKGLTICSNPLPNWVYSENILKAKGVYNAHLSWSTEKEKFVRQEKSPIYEQHIFSAPLSLVYNDKAYENFFIKNLINKDYNHKIISKHTGGVIWTILKTSVLIFSFNEISITLDVIEALKLAIDIAEQNYSSLVIWKPSSLQLNSSCNNFAVDMHHERIESTSLQYQALNMRIKYAQVPVIAAISGKAVGNCCELLLHCALRVAYFESYLGLIDFSKASHDKYTLTIPSHGGLKELALQAANNAKFLLDLEEGNQLLEITNNQTQYAKYCSTLFKKYLIHMFRDKISTCAFHARDIGYLLPNDQVVFNIHSLLHTAISSALHLVKGNWRAPLICANNKKSIAVAGLLVREKLTDWMIQTYPSMNKFHNEINNIANVLCGGNLDAGTLVTENWFLSLERQASLIK